ncbi:hypothetical protein FXN70_02485 [Acinetobacter sp. MD2]|nr:hypothetical protein [Acinetobacter sp. MD2]
MLLHASILKLFSLPYFCVWIFLLLTQYAKASPLLNTDDTAIVAAHHCQLESAIVSAKQADTAYQVNTACQLLKGVESSIAYSATDSHSTETTWSAQLKTVLKPMDRWGVATSLLFSQTQTVDGKQNDWFLNVPVEWAALNERVHVYSNIGYQHSADQPNLLRWSLATNFALTPKTSMSLEAFNQDRQAPLAQTVLHYTVIPDLFTLEASFGQRLDDFRQRFFGFGLSFTP